MKKQKNYDKKVKQTRILLSDYLLLKQLSLISGVSMSQKLHELITQQGKQDKVVSAGTQIHMPVTTTKSMPIIVARSTPIKVSFSREVEHVDENRQTD